MPDVNDRDEKERQIMKVLMREFNRARLQLLGLIPDLDPWMVDVPPEFWQDHQTKMISGLSPHLSSAFVQQSNTMMDGYQFTGIDWGLINEAAAKWAKDYTFELVKDLNDTSRGFLQRTIPRYFEEQMTQGQLRDLLSPKNEKGEDTGPFGRVRAESIARTEVTRAASEGEQETARQLEAQGIKLKPFWQTRNDEIVRECPICWPRHEKEIRDDNVTQGQYPPGHPRCRCWVIHEMVSE